VLASTTEFGRLFHISTIRAEKMPKMKRMISEEI